MFKTRKPTEEILEKLRIMNRKIEICNTCELYCECKDYLLTKEDLKEVKKQYRHEWKTFWISSGWVTLCFLVRFGIFISGSWWFELLVMISFIAVICWGYWLLKPKTWKQTIKWWKKP